MIDQRQRHRRKLVAAGLLVCGSVMLLVTLLGRVLLDQLLLGTIAHSYALLAAWVVIFLALAGSGLYLLRTIRRR